MFEVKIRERDKTEQNSFDWVTHYRQTCIETLVLTDLGVRPEQLQFIKNEAWKYSPNFNGGS